MNKTCNYYENLHNLLLSGTSSDVLEGLSGYPNTREWIENLRIKYLSYPTHNLPEYILNDIPAYTSIASPGLFWEKNKLFVEKLLDYLRENQIMFPGKCPHTLTDPGLEEFLKAFKNFSIFSSNLKSIYNRIYGVHFWTKDAIKTYWFDQALRSTGREINPFLSLRVIDRHIIRAAGENSLKISLEKYREISNAIDLLAKQYHINPNNMQAILWVIQRKKTKGIRAKRTKRSFSEAA